MLFPLQWLIFFKFHYILKPPLGINPFDGDKFKDIAYKCDKLGSWETDKISVQIRYLLLFVTMHVYIIVEPHSLDITT